MLLCDGPGPCNVAKHTWCCKPPLSAVPSGPFFCCRACALGAEAASAQQGGRMHGAPGAALASLPPSRTGSQQVSAPGGPLCTQPAAPVQHVSNPSPPAGGPSPQCDVCLRSVAGLRVLSCAGCGSGVHPGCLGLSPHAYPAGVFQCAACVLLSTRLEVGGTSLPAPSQPSKSAVEAAHNLVWLKGKRVQDSSQATYASALHRYVHFAVAELGLPVEAALPPGVGIPPPRSTVQLFVAWAVQRYKIGSVRVTLNALADWCKSKFAPASHVHNAEVEQLLHTAATEQGPAGLPVGKRGMSKAVLQLLLAYLGEQARGPQARMAQLLHRDVAWLLLGFFGMMRRSELVALCMKDVVFVPESNGVARHLQVHVARSKTDRCAQGATVVLAGATCDGWDVWSMVSRYTNMRTQQDAGPEDPFLVAWNLDAWALSSQRLASAESLAARLKQHLREVKARYPSLPLSPESYGMHSLRRGGVLAAWAAGVELAKIKAHGRWRSDNGMRPYLTAGIDIKLQVTSAM